MWCSGCMGRRIRGWVDAWEHFEMHHVLCCRPAIDSRIWMSWSQRTCFVFLRGFSPKPAWEPKLIWQCCFLHSKTYFNTNPFWFQQSAADICHGESTMVAEVNITTFDPTLPPFRPSCAWLSGAARLATPVRSRWRRWRSRRGKNPKLVPGSWRRCAWGMPPCPLMLQVDLWPRFSWAKDPIRSAGIPPSMTTWIQRWRRLGPWGIFYAWIDGGRHLKRKNAPWNPELPGWGRFSPDLLGLLPSEVEKTNGTPKFFCSGRILSTTRKQRQQCWIIQTWTSYHPLELVWSFRSTNLPSFSLPSLQDSSKVAGPPNHLKFTFFSQATPLQMNGVFQFFILLFPPFSVQHVPNFYHQKLHTVHTPPRPGQGMPYHGEATSRQWHWSSSAASAARLGVQLPMAGLEVERSVELLTCSAMLGLGLSGSHDLRQNLQKMAGLSIKCAIFGVIWARLMDFWWNLAMRISGLWATWRLAETIIRHPLVVRMDLTWMTWGTRGTILAPLKLSGMEGWRFNFHSKLKVGQKRLAGQVDCMPSTCLMMFFFHLGVS